MISVLCILLFEAQDRNVAFSSCSPGIGWHDNDISFVVAVSHNVEIGFFIQVPFTVCVHLNCTKCKNDTNAMLFDV